MDSDNRDFLKLVRDTEAALNALLAVLGAKLVRIIQEAGRTSKARQKALIDAAIRDYVNSYRVTVTDAVASSGGLQADKNSAKLLPLLTGAPNEQDFMGDRFSGYREVIQQRFPTQRHPDDLKTFEQRVVNIRRGFQRTIYQVLQQGVDQGTDPRKVAFQIRDAVVMTPKSPGSLSYREAAKLRDVASSYVYRGAPSGSIQYNSMRIVRTEMANIYRRSVTDFYDDRPYNEGYEWLLSNRHERADRCNGYASGSPYKSRADLPSSHPMCLCRVVARIMSQEKLKQLIASGAID